MGLRKLIEEYLKDAKLMQLATSIDNQPWVCSVWFAADENLNIYWFSSTARRHSKEVMKNQRVAGAITLPQSPEDPPRGLQFQGIAEVLDNSLDNSADINKAISVYASRIFTREKIKKFMENEDSPHQFYRVRPSQFILFDIVNFPSNPRQEYSLLLSYGNGDRNGPSR